VSQCHPSIARAKGHRALSLGWNQTLAKRLILRLLSQIEMGCLRLHQGDERYEFGQAPEDTDLVADLHVHDPQAYTEVAFGGAPGSGEAYMSGYWSTPNLTQVTRIFVRNQKVLEAMGERQSMIGKTLLKLFHRFNRNSKEGAKRNIAAHYDLGNDFFKLFLDPSMMYSSAIYPSPEASLAEAAEYKLKRICDKLELGPQDHLLEIGTGWGGLAVYAAKHYGCKVTTTTISRAQWEQAQKAVREAGLEDSVTLLMEDYRDLTGRYDKLVSVEMIEAVGHEHFDIYFRRCSELLADDGLMLLQAITIADQRYARASRRVDFIQRYIFPGGSLPSVSLMTGLMRQLTDMSLLHMEEIGQHYARTLRDWRLAFDAQLDKVRAMQFDERFIRMWQYYLCYCEGGFMERSIGTAQLLMAKPNYRQPACHYPQPI